MSNVTLGKTYKHQVSGFVGVATCHCEYLSGEVWIELTAKVTREGESVAAEWFNSKLLTEIELKAGI